MHGQECFEGKERFLLRLSFSLIFRSLDVVLDPLFIVFGLLDSLL